MSELVVNEEKKGGGKKEGEKKEIEQPSLQDQLKSIFDIILGSFTVEIKITRNTFTREKSDS